MVGSWLLRRGPYFQIQGQAIVGTWDDQGGNHATADITYDSARNAPQSDVLKLVE
jgi:hypothetical protein